MSVSVNADRFNRCFGQASCRDGFDILDAMQSVATQNVKFKQTMLYQGSSMTFEKQGITEVASLLYALADKCLFRHFAVADCVIITSNDKTQVEQEFTLNSKLRDLHSRVSSGVISLTFTHDPIAPKIRAVEITETVRIVEAAAPFPAQRAKL